jgi:hypothetical protein
MVDGAHGWDVCFGDVVDRMVAQLGGPFGIDWLLVGSETKKRAVHFENRSLKWPIKK